ncbi:hypothetical protein Emed_001209 [Eimeria media]
MEARRRGFDQTNQRAPEGPPKNAAGPSSRRETAAGPSPELIRRKLEQVMGGKDTFRRSAAASFRPPAVSRRRGFGEKTLLQFTITPSRR